MRTTLLMITIYSDINVNQVIRRNGTIIPTKQLRNAQDTNYCLKKYSSGGDGVYDFALYQCDSNSNEFKFDYDINTKEFTSVENNNLCIDWDTETAMNGVQVLLKTRSGSNTQKWNIL